MWKQDKGVQDHLHSSKKEDSNTFNQYGRNCILRKLLIMGTKNQVFIASQELPRASYHQFQRKACNSILFCTDIRILRGMLSCTGLPSKRPVSFLSLLLQELHALLSASASHTSDTTRFKSQIYPLVSFLSCFPCRNHYSFSVIHFTSSVELPATSLCFF